MIINGSDESILITNQYLDARALVRSFDQLPLEQFAELAASAFGRTDFLGQVLCNTLPILRYKRQTLTMYLYELNMEIYRPLSNNVMIRIHKDNPTSVDIQLERYWTPDCNSSCTDEIKLTNLKDLMHDCEDDICNLEHILSLSIIDQARVLYPNLLPPFAVIRYFFAGIPQLRKQMRGDLRDSKSKHQNLEIEIEAVKTKLTASQRYATEMSEMQSEMLDKLSTELLMWADEVKILDCNTVKEYVYMKEGGLVKTNWNLI